MLTEEVELIGGKNKKFIKDHKDDFDEYVKKGEYQIRPCKQNETVEIRNKKGQVEHVQAKSSQFLVRDAKNARQAELISDQELAARFQPIDDHAEADAEGFKTYREIGKYFALQYTGEQIYIFTDWSTKQKLSEGDYFVKPAATAVASDYVVPAAVFAEHFQKDDLS